MLNAVHAEMGRKLDDGLEKRHSQQWARGYEQARGRIFCPQRLIPAAQREPAPPRPDAAFSLTVQSRSGAAVARSIDWLVTGYGRRLS